LPQKIKDLALGYYGKIIYEEVKIRKKHDQKISFMGVLKIIRNMILEFGTGEYLDSFVIRPTAMYFFPKLVGNMILGLFLGKIAADITFYIPTIIAYELKKKYLKD